MINQEQLKIIRELSLKKDSLENTAYKLGYTIRHTRRKLYDYLKNGNQAFVHKNTNRTPINKISQALKDEIIELYETKYYDFSIKHYWELVWKEKFCYSSVRKILLERNILINTLHKKRYSQNFKRSPSRNSYTWTSFKLNYSK